MSHPLHLAGAFQRGTAEVHPLSDSIPARERNVAESLSRADCK
jgi:hypothetical protein